MTWRRLPHISSINIDIDYSILVHYMRSQKKKKKTSNGRHKMTGQRNMCTLAPGPALIHSRRNKILQLHYEPSSIPAFGKIKKLHKQIDWFLTSGVRDKHTHTYVPQYFKCDSVRALHCSYLRLLVFGFVKSVC